MRSLDIQINLQEAPDEINICTCVTYNRIICICIYVYYMFTIRIVAVGPEEDKLIYKVLCCDVKIELHSTRSHFTQLHTENWPSTVEITVSVLLLQAAGFW